jgi:hypothetical protein
MIEFAPSVHHDRSTVDPIMCAPGSDCDTLSAGHSLSFMRHRLAAATPSKWVDAIVSEVVSDGRIRVTTVGDRGEVVLWHHADLTSILEIGEPVALHSVYQVLAAGSNWVNVAIGAS